LVVIFGRIPAIVATLGLLGIYRAGIFLALGGSWLSGLPVGLTNLLAARIFGLPVSVLVIALAYAAVFVAVRLTPFGAHLLAIGNSEARARLAGIGVRRVQVAAFVISGGLCGLAASFYVATYRNVEMTIGATLALEAVAAVVLGGTAVTGGRISLLGTAFGVILLRLVQNGLLLVGAPSLWQPVLTGLLLLLVLGAEALSGRWPLERLRQSALGAAWRIGAR
jgi:ribose/xylose/arabinose/galactoside ABC-type transport system permease subunit